LEVEGIDGFFSGVKAVMIGQALMKSVTFSANELALGVLNDNSDLLGMTSSSGVEDVGMGTEGLAVVATGFVNLIVAASFS